MKPEQDGYGQMLWAFYKGEESFIIIERVDGVMVTNSAAKYFAE